MGFAGKIVLVLIGVALLLFAATQFGIINYSVDGVNRVDAKYGLGEQKLVPGYPTELEAYKKDLRSVIVLGDDKKIIELKEALAEMQSAMNNYSESAGAINLSTPDCSFTGVVANAKKDAQGALYSAKKVVAFQKTVPHGQLGYLSGNTFDSVMANVVSSLQKSVNQLQALC
ncbi:MAG: hypothetical protein AABW99_03110 [archaeon]